MVKQPLYKCPWCEWSMLGNIGKHWLEKHVAQDHPDKMEQFRKKKPEELYELQEASEQPAQQMQLPQQQPVILQVQAAPVQQQPTQQQQQPFQEPQPVMVSSAAMPEFLDTDPAEFLSRFLKSWGFKDLFIRMQLEEVQETGELPFAATLQYYMKNMDSGQKNDATIQYICQRYEKQLQKYLQRLEEKKMMPHGGGFPVRTGPWAAGRRGIPVMYENDRSFYQQPIYGGGMQNDRLARLEDELRRREDEDRRRQEARIQELTMKLEQSMQGTRNPDIERLEMKIEEEQKERRRLEEQLAQQREQNLLKEIGEAKQMASHRPTSEDIKGYIDQSLEAKRRQLLVEMNVEDLIDKRLGRVTGPSQVDVDLKKAEHEFEINKMKLGVEEKKGEMWQDTLKGLASVAGEAFGKGLASGQQPQQSTEAPPSSGEQVLCPNCKTALILPPGAKAGVCSVCNSRMVFDEQGTPHIIQRSSPQIPPQQTIDVQPKHTITVQRPPLKPTIEPPIEQPEEEPDEFQIEQSEEAIGLCPVCKKPVHPSDIGKTENGRPYHKQCSD